MAIKKGKARSKKTGKNPKAKKNPGPEGKPLPANGEAQICPMCGELLGLDSTKCDACGSDISGGLVKKVEKKEKKEVKGEGKEEKMPDKNKSSNPTTAINKDSSNIEDDA